MKKLLSLLLAIVMLMGLSVGVMADTVTVKDVADATAKNYTVDGKTSSEPLMIVTLLAYEKTYPDSEYKLSDEQKESLVETYSEKIQTQTGAAQISQSALVLLGLGSDPENIPTADGGSFNALQKISDLITDDTKNAWMKNSYGYFNYPYCFYILQQYGDEYQDAIDKLLEVAKTNSASWMSTSYGPDGLGFVMPALAPYYDTDPEIKKLLDESAEAIKAMVDADGKIAYKGYPNGNEYSTGLCVNCLASIGIDPATVKAEGSDKSLVDGLLSYAKDNILSSEQSYRGVIAAANAKAGEPYFLWDINDIFEPINVSFRLIGDTKHKDGVEGHDEYVNWIKTVSYEMPAGSTVQDLLDKAVADYKLEYKVKEDEGYVYAVKAPGVLGNYWLEEKMNGDLSGWMYTVKNEIPQLPISQQKLMDDDAVVFHYCDDFTLEEKENGEYYYRWLEAADITPEEYAASLVMEPSELPFTDVKEGKWYDEEVAYVYSLGLMVGTSDTEFKPDDNLSRAQMATILYRMEGEPEVTSENPFTDVPDGTWYTDAVIWAAETEVVKGVGNGKFDPGTNIDREEMACMMYRYAKFKGEDMTASASLDAFPDAAKVSSWAEKEMKYAVAKGLINGSSNNGVTYLDPQGGASRAQASAVLMRFHKDIYNVK